MREAPNLDVWRGEGVYGPWVRVYPSCPTTLDRPINPVLRHGHWRLPLDLLCASILYQVFETE